MYNLHQSNQYIFIAGGDKKTQFAAESVVVRVFDRHNTNKFGLLEEI